MISLIIPSYNNLQHLKNVYASIQKHAPEAEVILLDDGSTDGTHEWMKERCLEDENLVVLRVNERMGHTILYDMGINYATNEIVGILHADMILGPNYVKNMLKHLEPGKVVCATRIEPPLHPEGKEKIIADFGMDFDTLNIDAFEKFVKVAQKEHKDTTTKGMFAPWILYKQDFLAIGGHDPLFAPFPYEDSDIFQRWILAGYELIQSRDAFVYHLTCRGHRWNDQIGHDDDYFKIVSARAARNYLRKWGTWIKNDEYQHPIVPTKYNIICNVKNCYSDLLTAIEPRCDTLYVDCDYITYISQEQPNTKFDLTKRISYIQDEISDKGIIVYIDGKTFNDQDWAVIQNLSDIVKDSGDIGEFSIGNLKVVINDLTEYQNTLIKIQ